MVELWCLIDPHGAVESVVSDYTTIVPTSGVFNGTRLCEDGNWRQFACSPSRWGELIRVVDSTDSSCGDDGLKVIDELARRFDPNAWPRVATGLIALHAKIRETRKRAGSLLDGIYVPGSEERG